MRRWSATARRLALSTLLAASLLLQLACSEEERVAVDDVEDGAVAVGQGSTPSASSGGDGGTDGLGGSGGGGASASGSGGSGDGGSATTGWRTLAPLPGGARQETAVVARSGEVWVLGGFDASATVVDLVEIYDPETDAWRDGPDLPVPMHHANIAVVGQRVFILGYLEALAFDASPEVWELVDDSGQWDSRTPIPGDRARGASAVIVDGTRVVVCGGFRNGAVAECDAYDPVDDAWNPLPDLPEIRDHVVGAALDGRVLVVGGREGTIPSVAGDVWELDEAGDGWTTLAPMRTPRGGAAAAPLGGRLYVAGGEGDPAAPEGVFEELEAYDADDDAWTALAPMPTPRHGTGAAAVAGMIVIPGGATAEAFAAVDVVEAYVP